MNVYSIDQHRDDRALVPPLPRHRGVGVRQGAGPAFDEAANAPFALPDEADAAPGSHRHEAEGVS